MKKQLPAWAGCLLLIVLTVFATRFMWLPITENTGERSMQVLEKAFISNKYVTLDFGHVHDYRIARSDATEALLDEAAIGQTYEVTARYHSGRSAKSKYYEVLALSGADGTIYRTLEEAEASRQADLPLRLGLLIGLDTLCCALLIWRERKLCKCSNNIKEESP